jgi:hypothetical protein
MLEIRAYRLGADACVVKVSGDLDGAAVDSLAEHDDATVFDLLDARLVDVDALDMLVARSGDAVFIAERPLLDALELISLHRPVQTAPSLAAALR